MKHSRPSSLSIQDTQVTNLSEKLKSVDFHTPAKIFQNTTTNNKPTPQHLNIIQPYENVTPDVSVPGTPMLHHHYPKSVASSEAISAYPSPSLPPTAIHTPPTLSPHRSDETRIEQHHRHSSSSSLSSSSTTFQLNQKEEEEVENDQEVSPISSSSISPSSTSQQSSTTPSPTTTTTAVTTPGITKSSSSTINNSSHISTSTNTRKKSSSFNSKIDQLNHIKDISIIIPNASLSTPSTTTSLPSRPTTPSQFIFKKPEYNKNYHNTHFHHLEKKDTILHELKRFFKTDKKKSKKSRPLSGSTTSKISDLSFANEFNKDLEGKYGKWGRFVGKGAGGSVRLIRRSTDKKTFAVKQFRKRGVNESEKEYVKKVTAEFCIGSILHHPNVIETLDIIQEGANFYEIMEFAPNDLFNIVMSGKMTRDEISCYWKQLLDGVNYLQSTMGIAHRDLKLDNCVVDDHGLLKIIDFGCSVVIKYPHSDKIHQSKGVCGSDPYIAPEQYTQPDYDATLTDLWSCGIIYVCMIIRRFPWRIPRASQDQSYKNFVTPSAQGAARLFKMLPRESRPILTKILEPDPSQRCTLQDVLTDPWVSSIDMCTLDYASENHCHHLLVKPSPSIMEKRQNIVVLDTSPPPSSSPTPNDDHHQRRTCKKKK